MFRIIFFLFVFLKVVPGFAQIPVNITGFNNTTGTKIIKFKDRLEVSWPAGASLIAKLVLDLKKEAPLFQAIQLGNKNAMKEIAGGVDPAFVLTIGKRDLVSQNGWNIFFDKVPLKPHQSYPVTFNKESVSVHSKGTRTIISISTLSAATFTGNLEITLYEGSPLFNIAAVMTTDIDSTAIVYDAGFINRTKPFTHISWCDTTGRMQSEAVKETAASTDLAVRYRTIIGESKSGSLAIFPAPHQYFYPLDECFNLKFTWFGNNYRDILKGYGLGIRQELTGDKRYVPWFNAPPKTAQRLNFFCLLSNSNAVLSMEQVKKFTHNDTYLPIPGYKTMSSHFHMEHVMKDVLAKRPMPDTPDFVSVFKKTGIDIIHLAEFHYTAHPKGPDDQRLNELATLFAECKRLSTNTFLLLPGEEPNEFFGGHWLQFFPRPVYWIMSRKDDQPFVETNPTYGNIYRIKDKTEMLRLLDEENGLAWTAHARTKGSTGYPDKYKGEDFFKSDRFLGAAWKAMPADLSQPMLGKRVLDLMDDMANWGLKKNVIGEADLFQVYAGFELYAHLNVNYLQLDKLPAFNDGWQSILDVMRAGKFFVSTGEVLLPFFTVNGKGAGETAILNADGNTKIEIDIQWTFPLQYAEIISGDGNKVYREKIDLTNTKAFAEKKFMFDTNLKNRKWVRIEVWDAAANGAFTQMVWLQ